jgi:hypothetical protein
MRPHASGPAGTWPACGPSQEPLRSAGVQQPSQSWLPRGPRREPSPANRSPESLNGRLRESAKAFSVPPQKSHKSAARAIPTRSPRTRRHSPAHPGTHAKIETKTAFEQAKRRCRRLSAVPIGGGQGQDRTVDLPLFRDEDNRRSAYALSVRVPPACTITTWSRWT